MLHDDLLQEHLPQASHFFCVDPGGLMVTILATGSEVRGFNPGHGSHVIDLHHVKEPQAEIRASEQNLSLFTLTVESHANDLRC